MNGRAVGRFVRISPRKARLVADLVRGKRVDQAINILGLTTKKASPIMQKVIESAMANAKSNGDFEITPDDSSFIIDEVRVDEGPTMKRIRPRAQGRAFQILKRTSHIKVTVAQVK
ncbi:MAG: 50S ribosomal protein L22 [bacterium]|nr:50S ribosomal protein L22 [bacterium]MCP4798594.1 50S ribosomal protein L22 [bacterium]